jgi:hypothetical protein
MKIYVGHASDWDFQAGLYDVLNASPLAQAHHLILPHRDIEHFKFSQGLIAEADLLLAEVSRPSIGLGMELAWAREAKTPVLAIRQEGSRKSTSLHIVTPDVYEYKKPQDMIDIIDAFLRLFSNSVRL